jgi:hypothetical protein
MFLRVVGVRKLGDEISLIALLFDMSGFIVVPLLSVCAISPLTFGG